MAVHMSDFAPLPTGIALDLSIDVGQGGLIKGPLFAVRLRCGLVRPSGIDGISFGWIHLMPSHVRTPQTHIVGCALQTLHLCPIPKTFGLVGIFCCQCG